MSRRKKANEDLETNVYASETKGRTYYVWRHPLTFNKERLGTDRAAANVTARALNRALIGMGIDPTVRAPKPVGMTVAELIAEFAPRATAHQRSQSAKKSTNNLLKRLNDLFGELSITRVTVRDLADPLENLAPTTYVDMRGLLIRMFAYALSRGHIPHHLGNAAAVLEKRSDPKPVRQRLNLKSYRLIYEHAPGWLQVAMDMMLYTSLRPIDIMHLRYDQIIDNVIYTQVRKTQKFIGIELGDVERAVIERSKEDGVKSPYIVHRAPRRWTSKPSRTKSHHTQLTLDILSGEFSRIRDELAIGKGKKGTPPTLYEIRSLSGRLYAAMGREKVAIGDLFAHTDLKMTDGYLDPRDLARADVKIVRAGLQIRDDLDI